MSKLIESLNNAAQIIQNKNINGSANYIVCSPKGANLFKKMFEEQDWKEKNELRKKKLERILNGF